MKLKPVNVLKLCLACSQCTLQCAWFYFMFLGFLKCPDSGVALFLLHHGWNLRANSFHSNFPKLAQNISPTSMTGLGMNQVPGLLSTGFHYLIFTYPVRPASLSLSPLTSVQVWPTSIQAAVKFQRFTHLISPGGSSEASISGLHLQHTEFTG